MSNSLLLTPRLIWRFHRTKPWTFDEKKHLKIRIQGIRKNLFAKLPTGKIMTLLQLYNNTIFTFDEKVHYQVKGTPIEPISEGAWEGGAHQLHASALSRIRWRQRKGNSWHPLQPVEFIIPKRITAFLRRVGRHDKYSWQAWNASGSQTMWNASAAVHATQGTVADNFQIGCSALGGLQGIKRMQL